MKIPLSFERKSLLRAAIEVALLGGILLFGLLTLRDQLPENVFSQGVLFISGGCAIWYSLRLKIPHATRLRTAILELAYGAVLSTVIGGILPLLSVPTGYWGVLNDTQFSGTSILLLLASGPISLVFRLGGYIWLFWDRLRKQKLIWSLVHSQLTVVVIIVLLLVSVASVGLLIEANRNHPEAGPIAVSVTSRLVLTLLPFLGLASVFTVVTLVVILPPAALASYLFSRQITKRLEGLAGAASAFQRGEYGTRVEVHGEDEVTQLQANFNLMAEELEEILDDLHTERDKVATLLDSQRQLTASVSHELRTPLATIRGYLEPAIKNLEDSTPDTLHDDLSVIEQEIQRLERLIDDLFALSQAEVKALSLQLESIDVGKVAQRMVDTFAPLAWQSHKVEVIAQIGPDVPETRLDEGRLEQILANLLRNGIRHTPPGGIVAVAVSNQNDWVQIEVRDTGEGIASEILPHIWTRFFRGKGAHVDSKAGTGLGLALVKELTEAMGGTVAVESTVGEGSVFTVRFP